MFSTAEVCVRTCGVLGTHSSSCPFACSEGCQLADKATEAVAQRLAAEGYLVVVNSGPPRDQGISTGVLGDARAETGMGR